MSLGYLASMTLTQASEAPTQASKALTQAEAPTQASKALPQAQAPIQHSKSPIQASEAPTFNFEVLAQVTLRENESALEA